MIFSVEVLEFNNFNEWFSENKFERWVEGGGGGYFKSPYFKRRV